MLNGLRETVRHNLLVFRLAADGIDCEQKLTECMEVVTLAIYVMSARGEDDSPDFNVMRGTQSAMVEVASKGFKWASRHAVAIDAGTQRAIDITCKAKPSEVRTAYLTLMEGRIKAAPSVPSRD